MTLSNGKTKVAAGGGRLRLGISCSPKIKGFVSEILKSRLIEIDENADVYLVENGFYRNDKICIVFEYDTLDKLQAFLDDLSQKEENSSVVIGKNMDRYHVLDYEEVLYFEALDTSVYCNTADESFKVKEKLYELENTLPSNQFIRVSKSFIVNVLNIKEIIPWFNRRLLLRFEGTKKEIEVSRNYTMAFKRFMGIK